MTQKEKAKDLVNKVCKQTEQMFHGSELVRSEWMKICKEIAKSEIEGIVKILDGLHNPKYTCFDIYEPKQFTISEKLTDGYMLKQYFEEVISQIDKIV
jgi:hypothetical protein